MAAYSHALRNTADIGVSCEKEEVEMTEMCRNAVSGATAN